MELLKTMQNYEKNLEENHKIIFKSSTDTEVIPNLLQVNFEKSNDVKQTIMDTVAQLKGSLCICSTF